MPQFAYVQLFEFEALLFSQPGSFSVLPGLAPEALTALAAIAGGFSTPEDINDDPATAPSKRIEMAIPRYRKRLQGPVVAKAIGLTQIRAACPRFNDWVGRLESL